MPAIKVLKIDKDNFHKILGYSNIFTLCYDNGLFGENNNILHIYNIQMRDMLYGYDIYYDKTSYILVSEILDKAVTVLEEKIFNSIEPYLDYEIIKDDDEKINWRQNYAR